jgi:UDP-N-acetylmuramoylalanine--D-glutamate ligase
VSCARYLAALGQACACRQPRRAAGARRARRIARGADLRSGNFDESLLEGVAQVVVSPGVSLASRCW